MKLSELIDAVPGARVHGDASITVQGVTDDSRAIRAGDVFVAVPGRTVDGHDFAAAALARGAAALVVERPLAVAVPQVVVPSAVRALGPLAARAAGDPGAALRLVGITGTNGKTTGTYLVEAILQAAEARPGVIGTVDYRWGEVHRPAPYTTPPPAVLHPTLAEMRAGGATHAVLEVSSSALEMHRMEGLRFQVAVFTNLTQDHLDVHRDMDSYRAAKALLFSRYLADDGVAVVNVDDPAGEFMAAAAGAHRVLRVSARPDAPGHARADLRIVRTGLSIAGVEVELDTPRGRLALHAPTLLGAYNACNLALAAAVGEALALPHAAIAAGVAAMPGVPGRVERVPNRLELDILVDYAHTPDALENLLSTLKPLAGRRLVCVFGCGGDRDPGKRPLMGAAAQRHADLVVVTSDNPRTEAPRAIIDMILPAVPRPFFVHLDRRTAIAVAVAELVPGDILVIAGKGHEDYQVLGTEKVHFDDREEAAAAVQRRPTLRLDEAVRAAGGALLAPGPADCEFLRVVIDGRLAAPGDLYVAIRGERYDGHAFCAQAVAAGARGLLVDARGGADPGLAALGVPVIAVADTRTGLGGLARHVQERWHGGGGVLVGVTGSAGKTTTKELLAAALAEAGPVRWSPGSLNNETGVPQTLLGLMPHHRYAVVEMGMRGLGQIAYLAAMARPDVGVVTNAGLSHVGVVGSAEAIVAGKSEMFAALGPDGCAICPADDERLLARARQAPRLLTFGATPDADVRIVHQRPLGPAGSEVVLAAGGREYRLELALPGAHNARNAACALAAALAAGVDPEVAVRGMARARPAALRGEIRSAAGRHVLLDCYNANPASMEAALATLDELRGSRRAVAVLGDMLELGDESRRAHEALGQRAAALGIPVIALGEMAGVLAGAVRAAGGSAEVASDVADAARRALAGAAEGDWLLLKASRALRLERVFEALERSEPSRASPA